MENKSILDTRNYNECMKYVHDLEHLYIGVKLSPYKSERIISNLETFCKKRNYDECLHNTDSNDNNCSSVKVLGDTTLNTITRSPVDPSLVNPFPLIIFSSRF